MKIANSAARTSEGPVELAVASSSDSMYDCHGKKSSGTKESTGSSTRIHIHTVFGSVPTGARSFGAGCPGRCRFWVQVDPSQ